MRARRLAALMLVLAAGAAALARAPQAATPTPPALQRVYAAEFAAGPGAEIARGACVLCHGVPLVASQHKDSTAWVKTVDTMVAWGAPLAATQREPLIRYLLATYGPRR